MNRENLYQFEATNHDGVRLTWYFDLEEQARRAHAFADSFAYYAKPSDLRYESEAVDERGHVFPVGGNDPDGDYITDAGEFARWLTGDYDDDRLAWERYPEGDSLAPIMLPPTCPTPPDHAELGRLFTALSRLPRGGV